MSERQTRSSRHLQPSRNKKLDKILNVLIGIVIILIVLTAMYVFKWQDDAQDDVNEEAVQEQKNDDGDKEPPTKNDSSDKDDQRTEDEQSGEEDQQSEEEQQPEQNTAVETTSDDPIVERVVTDKNWKPTPTTQTGAHVSSYDSQSVDWAEKLATVTAVTGITNDNMIVWRVQNNGGANKAIATVSTKDKSEMYRVSMEWIDNEGWLPVKLEQLNTLEGAY
ncbi:YrrS family protein [Lysinibacillus sp. NPDC097195]|uniref:YrrS family protein n=1 Tax=Lysinibacillus sp. NPDC097195 TaxID=3364141 RepID=UPI00381D5894